MIDCRLKVHFLRHPEGTAGVKAPLGAEALRWLENHC